MKSYTDLEQSKKLAEYLPIESADMFWLVAGNTPRVHVLTEPLSNYSHWENYPCWSLAALLNIFDNKAGLAKDYDLWFCYDNEKSYCTKHYINAIDACYEMILKLHELKML